MGFISSFTNNQTAMASTLRPVMDEMVVDDEMQEGLQEAAAHESIRLAYEEDLAEEEKARAEAGDDDDSEGEEEEEAEAGVDEASEEDSPTDNAAPSVVQERREVPVVAWVETGMGKLSPDSRLIFSEYGPTDSNLLALVYELPCNCLN